MRILLTGDAGFIGTHLANELLENDHEAYGIDLVDDGAAAWSMRGRDLLEVGEGETSLWLNEALTAYDPDVVVHLAAQVGRLFGEDDVAHTIESNAIMSLLVARSVAAYRRPRGPATRLVYTSTSEVYGDLGQRTAEENGDHLSGRLPDWRIPHNLYGLSKRWGEEACAMALLNQDAEAPQANGGLQVIRPSMPYGPGLPPGRGRAAIVNMLWQAHNKREITVHEGAERSWCWIGDTVRGIRRIIESGQVAHYIDQYQIGFGCYNVGRDDNRTPMATVALLACDIASASPSMIRVVPAPARQTPVKRLSSAKLRALGWAPTVQLRGGMERTYAYMMTHQQLDPAIA